MKQSETYFHTRADGDVKRGKINIDYSDYDTTRLAE